MKSFFNLNILGRENTYRYAGRYDEGTYIESVECLKYSGGWDGTQSRFDGPIQFFTGYNDYVVENGTYTIVGESHFTKSVKLSDSNLTQSKFANFNLYFPNYSVETYDKTTYYALKVCTYINGVEVILMQNIVNRIDAVGVEEIVKLANERFYEYERFHILDANYIRYSSDFVDFVSNICKWKTTANSNINDDGSIVRVELQPIIKNEDGTFSNNEKYVGGSNSTLLTNFYDNALGIRLSYKKGNLCGIIQYNKNFDTLEEYIQKTYTHNTNDITYIATQAIMNQDGGYSKTENLEDTECETLGCDFGLKLDDETWNGFSDGLMYCVSVEFFETINGNEYSLMEITTEPIPVTSEMWSEMLLNEAINDNTRKNIDNEDMRIDVVNKIINQVVEVSRPDDYNAHVITPVFIRAKQTSDIEVHPSVNENIAINLDAYKSSVEQFILQIEGVEFVENSRSAYGVVFKVIGSNLPQAAVSGTYYILNQERTLVTTGNYKYIL